MVVLDAKHTRMHVKWELWLYRNLVTPGQYMVVEDCYHADQTLSGPGEAKNWFMERHTNFVQDPIDKQFLVSQTRDGWLRKI